jgi:hypothetical protein
MTSCSSNIRKQLLLLSSNTPPSFQTRVTSTCRMSSLLWTTTWSLQRLPWWRKEWKRFLVKATTERNWGRRLFSWSLTIACVRPSLRCATRSLPKTCSKGLDSKEVDDARAYLWCVFPMLYARVVYNTKHASFNCWAVRTVMFPCFRCSSSYYVLYSALQLQLPSAAGCIGFQHPFFGSHLFCIT